MPLPEETVDILIHELRLRKLEGEDHAMLDVEALKKSLPLSAKPSPLEEKPSERPRSSAEPRRGTEGSKAVLTTPWELKSEEVSLKEVEAPLPPLPKKTTPSKWEVVPGVWIEPLPKKSPQIVLKGKSKKERLDHLREQVLSCEVCREHITEGCQVVFGVGNPEAEIFFVGEAPGADEEKQGEPFVGRAGQLLTRMIEAMGLKRGEVYIGNIMNWRPEMPTKVGNRPPTQKEMEFCLPYLKAQVEIIQPKVLVALGNTAVSGLLGHDPKRKLGDIRGKWAHFGETPMMVTYHPAYILRNGSNKTKRIIWEDLLQVMERAGLEISEKQKRYFL